MGVEYLSATVYSISKLAQEKNSEMRKLYEKQRQTCLANDTFLVKKRQPDPEKAYTFVVRKSDTQCITSGLKWQAVIVRVGSICILIDPERFVKHLTHFINTWHYDRRNFQSCS